MNPERTEAGPATFELWRGDDVVGVHVVGEVDASNVGALRRVLAEGLVAGQREVVLDLSATEYLDSSGTALVANLAVELQARRGGLAVVAPTGSLARRVFELSGLARQLSLRDERGEGWPHRPPPG